MHRRDQVLDQRIDVDGRIGQEALLLELHDAVQPAPRSATGLLELGVAVALFSARWRDRGSLWAAALLIGFFPVNVYAAWQRVGGDLEREMGLDYLWVRAPLQLFLIGWALWPVLWPVLRPPQRKP